MKLAQLTIIRKNINVIKIKNDNMKNTDISTIIVIISLIVIGLYAMGEVNYFSSKALVEKNTDSPKIIIPSINLEETINNNSLNQGVLIDPGENIPTKDPIILFGHRTLQGSPFLRLNEIEKDDLLILEWPGIGELNYSVENKMIVPANYNLNAKSQDSMYLITCDPIGSTENRLVIESELIGVGNITNTHESNIPMSLIISAIFLILGLLLSYFYPKDNRRYILITIIIISALLFYFCINPIPSELIYDKILFINGGF